MIKKVGLVPDYNHFSNPDNADKGIITTVYDSISSRLGHKSIDMHFVAMGSLLEEHIVQEAERRGWDTTGHTAQNVSYQALPFIDDVAVIYTIDPNEVIRAELLSWCMMGGELNLDKFDELGDKTPLSKLSADEMEKEHDSLVQRMRAARRK